MFYNIGLSSHVFDLCPILYNIYVENNKLIVIKLFTAVSYEFP